MKLYEAKNIIKETFESSFNKEKFAYFIKNLLKNLEEKPFGNGGAYTGNLIPRAFQSVIRKMERVGKFEDEEGNIIDVLIVELNREHSIEYARTTQRNFIRWYLNGSRGNEYKDAALVAFHTQKSPDWRFSFIKMQYSLKKGKDELTPAKRSSFLVGEKGKSHTAQQQLINLLKNDYPPYLSDLEDAFNIEAVSDEFYEKYKSQLFNLKDELDKIVEKNNIIKTEFELKNIDTLNFTKKLLGQIVFLYFLQKKGWLGLKEGETYGEGDRNFMRELFNQAKAKGRNFFNDYLEFLFYDALSKKRTTDFYKRFNCRIPFLNGGLFDPIKFYDWENKDILIPNEIFSNKNDDDEEGSGILDIFDLYNFTVKEDEPLETEVAIDPEMLGKVFERMLEVKERKNKGAFYTPREIVHYMAQQSLVYFLDTELGNKVSKQDLEEFIHFGEQVIDKDIAIENGLLKEDRNKKLIPGSIRNNADIIDQALAEIKICDPAVGSGAFPVGVMNEIVKLRNILTPFVQDKNKRSAYYFKANAIQNSIYGVDIDAGAVEIAKLRLWLSMVVDESNINRIDPLPNLEYKIVKGNSLINMPDGTMRDVALENEIQELTKNYYTITDKEEKQKQKQIIDEKIEQLLKSASDWANYEIDFDFRLYFHEVFNQNGGFDLIIGNPPYDVYQETKIGELDIIKKIPIFEKAKGRKLNAFELFLALAPKLLKEKGHLSFIFQNSFLADISSAKLRRYYFTNMKILSIDSFPERDNIKTRVFKSAKMSVCILNSQKVKPFNSFTFPLIIWKERWMVNKTDVILSTENIMKLDPKYYSIPSVSDKEYRIIEKLASFKKIETIGHCYQGEINLTTHKKYLSTTKGNDYSPMIKGAAIQKWYITDKMSQEVNEFVHKSYLKDYSKSKKSLHHKFKRLVSQGITGVDERYRLKFAFLSNGIFCAHSANYVLFKNDEIAKLYMGILNSELLNWYFKKYSTNSNVNSYEVDNLPIVELDSTTKQILNKLIEFIIYLKQTSTDKQSFYFEQIIDGMVYELYFEKEIKKANCEIIKHLGKLPEITDDMPDSEKQKIIDKVFAQLYDKNHPVRKNLYFMDSVEEVKIIKESLEK